MKILCTLSDISDDLVKELKGNSIDFFQGSPAELRTKIQDYEIILVGLEFHIDKNVLSSAPKLQLIATATTGLDHIDLDFAEKNSISVISLKGETEFLKQLTSTAELAWGLMLDLMRGITAAFTATKNYQWNREDFRGSSLSGKTMGIIGFGRLGQMMAHYAQAFGMTVLSYDKNETGLANLIQQSDVISLHLPLDPSTQNIIDKAVLAKMKPTAFLINTARGGLVNEADLLEALEHKIIAGYATDVLTAEVSFIENKFSNHPLVEYAKSHPNLIITPHLGGMTRESRYLSNAFMIKKIIEWILRPRTKPLPLK